jgi:hypothetical protein
MREGFDKYRNGNANARSYYEAAFGTENVNVKAAKVDSVITKLQDGQLKAEVKTAPFNDKIAVIEWEKLDKEVDGKSTPWTPGNAEFSAQFHGMSYPM